nr:MAG TPA_asm: hypothetical protein [Caudoviricetes sp.]
MIPGQNGRTVKNFTMNTLSKLPVPCSFKLLSQQLIVSRHTHYASTTYIK